MENLAELKEWIESEIGNLNNSQKDMLLSRLENIRCQYPTSPGRVSLENIQDTGEKAFQRAIFNKREAKFVFKSCREKNVIKWLDLELPVIFSNRARRQCIDLIGETGDEVEKQLVICELKFMKMKQKSSNQDPQYAILELLVYYYIILRNWEKLDKLNVHHKGLGTFKWEWVKIKPLFIVGANQWYWKYWFDKRVENRSKLLEWLDKLKNKLKIEVFLFETKKDEDFEAQKGQKERYKPEIKSLDDWQEIYEVHTE